MEEKLNKIYDILVNIGGALEEDRDSFIVNHTINKYNNVICCQWRFVGHFGFGGKYLSKDNSVTYYREDKTPEREELLNKINQELSKIV